jgi:hypothetical protein
MNNNELELFNQDGTIFSTAQLTYSSADFNGEEPAWYFMREHETAEKYRQWAAARIPHAQSLLIRIQVPRISVDRLRVYQLAYSPEWKEYV